MVLFRFVRVAVATAVIVGALGVPGTAGAAPAPTRDLTRFACPPGLESDFSDIDGDVHELAIACLEALGVATGTSATLFSPANVVTRGQLASFVARILALAGIPLDISDAGFTDLGDSIHTDAINALANLGVMTGRTSTTFEPDAPARRGQAASVGARTLPGGLDPDPPDAFGDDDGSVHELAINQLGAVGAVAGVTAEAFDPDGTLSRAALMSFIARVLDFAVEVGFVTPPFALDRIFAALIGPDEVPGPGDDDAFGEASLLRGGLPGLLCIRYDIDGPFSAAPTAAHVHDGTIGVAGPIVLELPTPAVAAGERLFWEGCVAGLDQDVIDGIFADPAGHYVNIHTSDFPDGAVRGQLATPATRLATTLVPDEEAPGPGEDGATGSAIVVLPSDGRSVCSFVEYLGASMPTAVHIHRGDPGEAGPIEVTLPPFDVGLPVSDGCVGGLDPALVVEIGANPGDFYVNVHTEDHPDGAIRGQLSRSAFVGAELDGPSEVPGPGDPDGSGFALVELFGDDVVCVELGVRDIDRVTAAHIHRGTPAEAGPIVVTLPAPIFGASTGCVEADPEIVEEITTTPLGFYVNVHTVAFPDGAVRGQLAPDDL